MTKYTWKQKLKTIALVLIGDRKEFLVSFIMFFVATLILFWLYGVLGIW